MYPPEVIANDDMYQAGVPLWDSAELVDLRGPSLGVRLGRFLRRTSMHPERFQTLLNPTDRSNTCSTVNVYLLKGVQSVQQHYRRRLPADRQRRGRLGSASTTTGYDNNDVAAEGAFCLHRNDFWKMTALWTDAVMLLHTLGGKQLVNGWRSWRGCKHFATSGVNMIMFWGKRLSDWFSRYLKPYDFQSWHQGVSKTKA